MKPRNGTKTGWIIFVFGVLTTLVSCASHTETPHVLRSQKMDKQAKKICDQYDAMFIQTVCSNWWNMLDRKPEPYDRERGKVILTFSLHSNGQIANMKIAKRSTSIKNANLCKKAVLNGMPYQIWSEEILKALRTNICDVKFTFNYY